MLETFVEFTFEAAHQLPPHSGLHGHSFRAVVYLIGKPDPVFGWTHNLYDVESVVEATKQRLDHSYLNEIEGLEVPSLENIAVWIWQRLEKDLPGLDRVLLRRGIDGAGEGCCYSGRPLKDAA
jgi:6-pyruvoyltetrahydropterin/6-carboxytetrahydropterin synthase